MKAILISDDTSKGFFRSTLEGKFLDINQVFVEMLGYNSREALMQVDIARDLYIDPSIRKQILSEPAVEDKTTDVILKRLDGNPIPLRVNWRRVFDNTGEFLYFEGVVQDLSKSILNSKLLSIQHELVRTLLNAPDLQTTLHEVLSAVMRLDSFDCSAFYLINETTQEFEMHASVGGSEEFAKDVERYTMPPPSTQFMMQGKILCFTEADPKFPMREVFDKEGLKSVAVVPITHHGRIIGTINLGSRDPHSFTPAIRQAIETIAAQSGGSVARAQTEAARHINQQNLQSLCETLKDMIFVVDETGQLLYANPMASDCLGYTAIELANMNIRDLHPPERSQETQEVFSKILAGEASLCEIPLLTKNGRQIPVETFVARGRWGIVGAIFGVARDVTERNQSRLALQESETRFRTMFENAAIGMTLVDLGGTMLEVNYAFANMLGYTTAEITGKTFYGLTHKDDLETQLKLVNELVSGQRDKFLWEKRYLHKNGSIVWGRLNVSILRDEKGKPLYGIGIIENITQHKQDQDRLRDNEALFSGLFQNLPDFVLLVDSNAKILYCNHDHPTLTREQLVGKNSYEFFDPACQSLCRDAFMKALDTGTVQKVEIQDITGRLWSSTLVRYINQEGIQHILSICTDITEQKAAEEAILKEQQLLRSIIDIHERDRQITAYEIHDSIAQQITASLLHLEAFRRLRNSDANNAEKSLDLAVKLIGQSVDETRRLISGLRPLILDEYGIIEAIEYLVCEYTERNGIQITFNHDIHFKRLAPPLESAVFRIVQEALGNACRHSKSDVILMSLVDLDNRLFIKIRDNGIGFDPKSVPETCFGLRSIRERARLLGGTVKIDTSPATGTCITVELPLVVQATPEEDDDE